MLRKLVRRLRLNWSQISPLGASRAAIFSKIYASGIWGGADKGPDKYHSGTGSRNPEITIPYVDAVRQFIRTRWEGRPPPTVVDLGCGDFTVGAQLRSLAGSYVGVDIVPDLIERNRAAYGDAHTRFECLDIVSSPLPSANLCLVRQVLQHLSNEDIMKVLEKLSQYDEVLITEHVPSPEYLSSPNRDKRTGPEIRLYWGSGVYLDRPPFDVPAASLSAVLSVAGHPVEPQGDAGYIVTTRYTPRLR